jgi:hypothetical protein
VPTAIRDGLASLLEVLALSGYKTAAAGAAKAEEAILGLSAAVILEEFRPDFN